PGTSGNTVPGSQPLTTATSLWQMPQASTATRTSPNPGSGSSRSPTFNGPPASATSTARMPALPWRPYLPHGPGHLTQGPAGSTDSLSAYRYGFRATPEPVPIAR